VVIPTALPGVVTGALLALSRAAGETAPVLLVVGVSGVVSWSPSAQTTTLPLLTFLDYNSSYSSQQGEAWGIALVLITIVLALNLSSRFLSSERGVRFLKSLPGKVTSFVILNALLFTIGFKIAGALIGWSIVVLEAVVIGRSLWNHFRTA
jgi:hypothetical protein